MSSSAPVQPEVNTQNLVIRLWAQTKEALKVLAGTPRILSIIWNSHPAYTLATVILNLLLGLTPLAEMWVVKLLIDSVVALVRASTITAFAIPHRILLLLVLLTLIRVVSNAMEPTSRFVQEHLGDFLTRDVQLLILRKANSFVGMSVFENPDFHDLLQKAQSESSYRPLMVLTSLTSMLRSCVGLSSMILTVVALQPLLACAVVILSLPHLIVQFRQQYDSWAIQSNETPEVRRMNYFSWILTDKYSAKELRMFGLNEFFLGRYKKKFGEYQARHAKLRISHWHMNVLLATIAAVGTAGAYTYVIFRALINSITIGSLSLYLSAITYIQYNLEAIIWSVAQLYKGNLFVNNVFEFLNLPADMKLAPAHQALVMPVKLLEGIRFEDISFQYPDSERKVLDGVSFLLPAGKTVALVGENGAGKTTLVKLLSRLYDPSSGRVCVDGKDLRDFDLTNWRKHIAVIFQDYSRFHMTASENIGIGEVERIDDLAAVKAAAERGSAAPVINRLASGYDTTLGRYYSDKDRGAELSGGEWQKIALSRAFMRTTIKSPSSDGNGDSTADSSTRTDTSSDDGIVLPIDLHTEAQLLILDEPTSALDAQAEYEVYLRFHELTHGKSTLLISHRFSTVRMADLIVLLENGKITEQGTHEKLMAHNGEYARLYNLQADRYK